MARLEPMPVEGPVALFSCLPYWFKVVTARLKRGGVIRSFRREMLVEQRKLDEILRDLGKRAREVELQHPPVDAAMRGLHELEAQRAQLETDSSGINAQVEQQEATFQAVSDDAGQRAQVAQEQAAAAQATLNERNAELRGLKGQLAQLDKELTKLAATLRTKTAQGAKTQDATQQQTLEQECVGITGQIEEMEQQRGSLDAQSRQLEEPIAELTGQLADARTRNQEAQQELNAARQELATVKRNLGVESQKKGQEMTRIDREMAQKFLEIGRLLDTDRVQLPELEELFGRIDEARMGLQVREESVAALESEREAYDRAAAKKGMILAISIAGTALLVIIGLIILFTVVLN